MKRIIKEAIKRCPEKGMRTLAKICFKKKFYKTYFKARMVKEPKYRNGGIRDTDIRIIHHFLQQERVNSFLQIGTFWGESIFNILDVVKSNIELTTVDYGGFSADAGYRCSNFKSMLHDLSLKDKIQFFEDGSNTFFENNQKKFDLIFIDGDHTYDQSKRDLYSSFECLNEDGIILMHDIKPKWRFGCYKVFEEIKEYNTQRSGIIGIISKKSLSFEFPRFDWLPGDEIYLPKDTDENKFLDELLATCKKNHYEQTIFFTLCEKHNIEIDRGVRLSKMVEKEFKGIIPKELLLN